MTPQDEEKNSLAGIIARFAASKIYRQVTGLATAFLRPKLLEPKDFGLWQLLRIFPNYAGYVHLGTQTTMRYHVPKHLGQGDLEMVEALQRNALGLTMLMNGLVALGLVLAAIVGGFSAKTNWGLIAIAISVLILGFYNYQISILKAYEKFDLVTASNYVEVTFLSTLTILGLFVGGIYGLYVSFPLAYLITVIYNGSKFEIPIRPGLEWSRIKEMLAFGFPMMLMAIAIMLVNTSDRIMVASLLGQEALGYYGISAMVMGFLMNVPGAAREVLEPKLMRELEGRDLAELVQEHLLAPLKHTAYLMPILLGAAVFGLPIAIPFLLPNYNEGILPAQILTVGGYFFAHVIVLRGMIAARNLQRRAAPLILIPLVCNIVGSFFAVHWGYDLPGVAVASTIAYLVLYLVLFLLVGLDLGIGQMMGKSKIFVLVIPFPLMILLFWLSEIWPTPLGLSGIPIGIAKLVVFVSIMLGLRMIFGRVPQKEQKC